MKIIRMVLDGHTATSFILKKKRLDKFKGKGFTLFQFWPNGAKSKTHHKKVWWMSIGNNTPRYLSSSSWRIKFTFKSIRIGTTSAPKILAERSNYEGTKNSWKLLST